MSREHQGSVRSVAFVVACAAAMAVLSAPAHATPSTLRLTHVEFANGAFDDDLLVSGVVKSTPGRCTSSRVVAIHPLDHHSHGFLGRVATDQKGHFQLTASYPVPTGRWKFTARRVKTGSHELLCGSDHSLLDLDSMPGIEPTLTYDSTDRAFDIYASSATICWSGLVPFTLTHSGDIEPLAQGDFSGTPVSVPAQSPLEAGVYTVEMGSELGVEIGPEESSVQRCVGGTASLAVDPAP